MNIRERLDNLKIRIQQPDFLKGEGLSNEVGIWFFCYQPKDEMVVRDFTEKLVTSQSLSCHLVEKNLYSILLELCEDLDIADSIADMENDEGKVFLLEQLHYAIGVNEYISKIHFEPQVRGRDVLLLTGVGDVFPFMRVHNLLHALQPCFPTIPILVMYPGDFNGTQVTLFNKLKPNDYYRAFNLIDGGND